MKNILWIISIFLWSTTCFGAALFDLEIINIKPAGTGSPAIPATNRIFRAYPGIEYNIRAAVVGGEYPYTYSLSNAPAGMTINSATGEITWTNPQASASNIQLSVTDQESTTVSATWSITVTSSTSDFIFIQSGYSGTETGNISQPYSSLANMLSSETSTTKIVYFKSGTYPMVDHNSSADYVMNIDSSPKTWIAYPGANVILQGGSSTAQDAHCVYTINHFYFDGLEFRDVVNYGIYTGNGALYKTVRRCKFDGLVPTDNVNNNYGFIFISSSVTDGYYDVIQDNEFTDWTGASAIGSIYDSNKMLIENNRIHSPRAPSTYSGIGLPIGIASKVSNDYLTIRGNAVTMNRGYLAAGHNAMYYTGVYNEICFNLFVNTGTSLNLWDWEIGFQKQTKYWRNTTIAPIAHRSSSNTGPYTYIGNVISNSGAPYSADHTVTELISHSNTIPLSAIATVSNNLTNTNAALLVDAANNYKLVSAHSAYVGSRGWQFADGSTPMEWSYTPPVQRGRMQAGAFSGSFR